MTGATVEFVDRKRGPIRAVAALLFIGIATGNYLLRDVSLGVLYIVPVILISTSISRWAVVVLALGLALMTELLGRLSGHRETIHNIALIFSVNSIAGLLVSELTRNSHLVNENLRYLRAQKMLRERAEAESRQIVESSPGAILLIGGGGRIERDNHAARALLAAGQSLVGQNVLKFLPALVSFLEAAHNASLVRTMVECGGQRSDGARFYAQMWVSSFASPEGPRLVVIFSDATEILRDREELGLRQLLMSSRIVAAAVSHEVKNLSAAAYRVYRELTAVPGIAGNPDYAALGKLLDNMRKLAYEELGPAVDDLKSGTDLDAVLQELTLILDPMIREAGIHFSTEIPGGLPRLRADHQGLLQVFLNLAENAERALRNSTFKKITLEAYYRDGTVVVRFANNGPALEDPDRLFHPLQPRASATGLGMFISRAILRTYGGELQHMPQVDGCCFLIQIPAAAAPGVQQSA